MIPLHSSRIKWGGPLKSFLIIFSCLISISSCTKKFQKNDDHLILRKRTGEVYRTNGNTCPFGSYFYRESEPIDCVCSRGLWIFYENSCGDPLFLQGSEKQMCTPIEFSIRKSLMVSDNTDPIFTVLHPKDGIVMKLFENAISEPFKVAPEELILISGEWKLDFDNGLSTCVGQPNQFCLYEGSFMNGEIISSVVKESCSKSQPAANSVQISPWRCAAFSVGKSQDARECSKRQRRSPNEEYQGRVLIPTNLGMNQEFADNYGKYPNVAAAPGSVGPENEDEEVLSRVGNPLIKSQIWNYLTESANVLLRLVDPPPKRSNFKIAGFTFLNIAKEIIQKLCPKYYVPKSHFDLAVNIFRTIQIRDMMYNEPAISHEQVERITNALTTCLKNVTSPVKFTENRGPVCNLTEEVLDNTVTRTAAYPFDPYDYVGRFREFESDQYIDIPHHLSPLTREPMIETVWSIFFNAHSICFPYFNSSVSNATYNDHHKFSTIMMSLFTNGILDLWQEVTDVQPDIYSGFLGNAKLLMANVAHCSALGRWEFEGETYPWDLKRPGVYIPPPSTTTSAPGVPTTTDTTTIPTGRKKRQVPSPDLRVNHQAQLGCLENIRENSFVCKE